MGVLPHDARDREAGRNHLAVTKKPQRGDIVLYGFGHGDAQHVGLFEKFTDGSGTSRRLKATPGQGNDANGGEVQRRKRNTSHVLGFVHVGA